MKKAFSFVLALTAICGAYVASVAASEFVYNDLEVVVEDLNPVRNCKSTTKYLDGYNLAIFKKGGAFVVWTDEALNAEQEAALTYAIENSGIDDLVDLHNPTFASGFETFDLRGQSVSISPEGVIKFQKKPTWSWFYRGVYYFPTPVVGEWVCVGSDSATGYDPNGRITSKGNWFMYNAVDVANLNVGESKTFDIQAGQYKNGVNFVGTYAVTKVADGQYSISCETNDFGPYRAVRFDGYNLWFNGTGSFVTSPGNQKGKATKATFGTPFAFSGDVLYVFAHFNVSYWEFVEYEPEVVYVK